jgi:hypothetical protein
MKPSQSSAFSRQTPEIPQQAKGFVRLFFQKKERFLTLTR